MGSGAVVKLGGSIVTEKTAGAPKVRDELVRRLGEEIVRAAPRPLVVVHGAGSYGHQIARRTGLHQGLERGATLFDWGETQRLQYELDSRVAAILLEVGLPVLPVQASATAVMAGGELEAMDLTALHMMLDLGLAPLLYGVPAVDRERGCSILSGDQIAPFLAARLSIDLVVHATDVDGVFDGDPKTEPRARRFETIDRAGWEAMHGRLAGSRAVDVTGGMAGKVGAIFRLGRPGLRARIVDATRPGRLAEALEGREVGTLVCWEAP
jgi:isopentenyl phosphate kinase